MTSMSRIHHPLTYSHARFITTHHRSYLAVVPGAYVDEDMMKHCTVLRYIRVQQWIRYYDGTIFIPDFQVIVLGISRVYD
jgi:hypothetical protein